MKREYGQPRQKKAAQTRKTLLDAARKLFAQHGYAGTSMRAISRNAGMADGLMYHYFPGGKKELFQVILKESLEQMRRPYGKKPPSMTIARFLWRRCWISFTKILIKFFPAIWIFFKLYCGKMRCGSL